MRRKQVLFYEVDKELMDYSLSKDNFSDYVKSLIAEDMKKIIKPSIYDLYKAKKL